MCIFPMKSQPEKTGHTCLVGIRIVVLLAMFFLIKRHLKFLSAGEAQDLTRKHVEMETIASLKEGSLHPWRLWEWSGTSPSSFAWRVLAARSSLMECLLHMGRPFSGRLFWSQEQETSIWRGGGFQALAFPVQSRCLVESPNLLKCAYSLCRLS